MGGIETFVDKARRCLLLSLKLIKGK